jgi:hypothetical protein
MHATLSYGMLIAHAMSEQHQTENSGLQAVPVAVKNAAQGCLARPHNCNKHECKYKPLTKATQRRSACVTHA